MLETLESLMVRQQVEPLQVFIGLETQNRYKILDNAGNEILFAYEESGFLGRQFLGGHRPLTIKIIDGEGNLQLIARRKFFWFFSHLELLSPEGAVLGRLQRRFKLIGRRFDLFDDQGKVGSVEGPMLRPNTFWIKRDGVELAKITKKWSGIAREAFTAADNFSAEFTDSSLSESHRWLVLGAAFAIDLDFFENRARGTGFRFG
ncbi:MAG: phospholipid scramblase-related protein [Chloroflexi bacterium]|nr:phospholipid scramblase-related protein [Chloroflexota bacterium]MCZ6867397.1 phospholipid scramblase-related protein [Chloroflexota bacterium]